MSSSSLDDLVRLADLDGEVEAGRPLSWLIAQGGGAIHALANSHAAGERRSGRPLSWSEQEDDYLRRNLGVLSEQEIAAKLGRSVTAVHLRWKRDLDLPAPSKKPGYYTGHGVAKLLGVDIHAIMEWDRRGIMHFRRLPGKRRIMQISKIRLWVWAINPMHWIYFKPERVRDPKLRRLLELRAERWGDEWWTTGQVAEYYGLSASNTINQAIVRGQLPAVRWDNWQVRRSDALARPFYPHKGIWKRHCSFSTPRADAFLVKALWEWGLSYAEIAKLMKWDVRRVQYRYCTLYHDKFKGVSVETEVKDETRRNPKDCR